MWLLRKASEFLTGLKVKPDKHPLEYIDRKTEEINAPYKVEPAVTPSLPPTQKEAVMTKTPETSVPVEKVKKPRVKKDPAAKPAEIPAKTTATKKKADAVPQAPARKTTTRKSK